ncbi:Sensitivity to red light reduced 1 [Theobroma cacao]|uniref:Sensitivity to red light reduced 1 n=1 Tax=Theobroma cacao TaxID=3641 RepID=A0A061F8P0_THECC|nr:Sensitivity to red light reduced 1 [Theobroma cacao]
MSSTDPATSISLELGFGIREFYHDAEEKSKIIVQEMERISREVRESEFYSQLCKQIESEEFQSKLSRTLGSHFFDVTMVIYALGSLERATPPKYQLAFALLLQQDFFGWITRIEVFDPSLSLADILVLEKFGCTVLWMNEECRRRVDSPTLFFMPYASKSLQGNLLEANWWPSNINQVILLTNRLSATVEDYHDFLRDGTIFNLDSFMENWEYLEAIHKCIQEINIHTNSENFADSFLAHLKDVTNNRYLHYQFYDLPFMIKMQYLEAIQNYTEEMRISLGQPSDNLLYNFAFHFFNVAPEIDMQTLLQGEEEVRLNFRRQFDKIWKIEEYQIVALIEALIINAWYEQIAETENDL